MIIIGDKEIEQNTIGVRSRSDGDIGQMNIDEFVKKIKDETNNFNK